MEKNGVRYFVVILCAISFSFSWLPSSVISQSQTRLIETMAGTGAPGFGGDGGPAMLAQFGTISALAVDSEGNLYVSDTSNHRIRRIDRSGIITTVAGTGTPGFNGDQRLATTAQLAAPTGITVDAVGNLYIADLGNHRIRRVDPSGIIITIAGNGVAGFSGDGGLALEASFNYPTDVVFDGLGTFYIADVGNYRVRRVDLNGIVTTVAGNGQRAFAGDGGPAPEASFKGVANLAITPTNDLLIVDRFSHRVRRIDQNGMITTLAGDGTFGYNGDGIPADQASMRLPQDVALDQAGNVYIADFANHRIRRVDSAGIITTLAGTGASGFSGDGGPADQASLNSPSAVAVDVAGNVYFADSFNYRIRVVRATGQ
ncbi:MAG: hypothetical protein HY314_15465 [Acidobacteria bacterium]|nr:hypothetical protein [Acidobacteriota bacterium]